MIIVSQLDQEGQMRGLITTLNKQRANYVPVSSPIVYAKVTDFKGAKLGEIKPGEASYDEYRALLEATTADGYARLVGLED